MIAGSINQQNSNNNADPSSSNIEYDAIINQQPKIIPISTKSAIKEILPNYSKLLVTEIILSICFLQANNTYMKVNDKTREALVLVKNLENFSIPIIIKTLISANIMITEKIGEKKPEEVGQIIQQAYILGVLFSIPISLFLYFAGPLWGDAVNDYFKIYAPSLPAFAIAEVNFQALIALGKYKHVMGVGVFAAGLIYGLTLGLTNGLSINQRTILPKLDEKGMPIAMAISHTILALFTTIWLHCDKGFGIYELKKCNNFYERVKQIKKLFILGAPLAVKEIIAHSYSMVFTAILVELGNKAEVMAGIAEQAFLIMEIPMISTSRILTQQLGVYYGLSNQNTDQNINSIIKQNAIAKVKACAILQCSILSIPITYFLSSPKKVSALCEKLSGSENFFNSEEENQLALIIQVLTVHMLIHGFSHFTTSVCHAFQKTWTPMWFEFGENIINAIAGWFFLKQLGLVAIDVGFIPTELMSGLGLAYLAFNIINKINLPVKAEILTEILTEDKSFETPFLQNSSGNNIIELPNEISKI